MPLVRLLPRALRRCLPVLLCMIHRGAVLCACARDSVRVDAHNDPMRDAFGSCHRATAEMQCRQAPAPRFAFAAPLAKPL